MESSESTKILIDSCRVFLKYAKREQVEGMLMLAGWSDTQCDKPMSSLLDGNKNGENAKSLDWQSNNLAGASRFFVEFLCRRCTSTT